MPRAAGGLLLLLCAACATYDDHLEPVQRDYYGGAPDKAAERIHEYLEAGSWGRMWGPDEDDFNLLRLELACVLQSSGRYAEAATLLQELDDRLVVLDYTNTTAADIAAFMFASGSPWRPSPPEQVLLNTQGMLNRLASTPPDLVGAQVEARRFGVQAGQQDVEEEEIAANVFARALAGFCFEQGGSAAEAREVWDDIEGFNPMRPLVPDDVDPGTLGTVLVVVQMGKAPVRRGFRLPLIVDGQIYQLRWTGLRDRPDAFAQARVQIDGHDQGVAFPLFDLGAHLERQYERDRPKLLLAAATQLLGRAVLAHAAGKATAESQDQPPDGSTAYWVELLSNLFLAELQPPDTRCWSLVPQGFHVLRRDVEPGDHVVEVVLTGGKGQRVVRCPVTVEARRPTVINVISDCLSTWDRREYERSLEEREFTDSQAADWEGVDDVKVQIRAAVGSS